MARLFTAGAELGAQAEGLISNGTPTADTAVKRTALASWKAAATNTYVRRDIAGVLARTYFVRGYYYFTNNPTGLHRMFMIQTSTGTIIFQIEMNNTGRVLRLLNSAGAVQATGTTALTAGQWYRIEISFNIASAGNSSIELKIDGVTELSGSFALGNTAPVRVCWGVTGGNIGGITAVHYDDLAINDDQGADQNSWPGEGSVYLCMPIADPQTGTNQGNWTKPGGAGFGRNTSIDNRPPIYQADSTVVGDAEKFIRNAVNAAAQLEIDVEDYTTAGVPSGHTIKLVVPRCGTGSSSSTDTAGDIGILSNPVGSQKAMTTFDNGVASATVTTWPTSFADPIYNPTVVRGTRPRLRLSRAAANRTVMVNVISLIVESQAPAGPTTHYGALSFAASFGAVVSGKRKTFGQLALPITFFKNVQGVRKVFGQLALPITFFKNVQGQRKTFGKILSPFIFGKTVSGRKTTFGKIVFPISIAIATAGIRVAQTLYGALTMPITFGAVINGRRKTLGQLTLPLTFNKNIIGQRKTFGQLIAPFLFSKDVRGQRKTFGQTAFPITIAIETAGIRRRTWYGAVALPIIFDKNVQGRRKVFGQIALPLIFDKQVRGVRETFGKIDFPIIFIKEAAGQRQVFGQLDMQTLFGKEISGNRKTFGRLAVPVTFVKEVSAYKETFGQIALPIDVDIVIDGHSGNTKYGSLSLPIDFGKEISAKRETFGQIDAPLIFGAASKGERDTFGKFVLPINFASIIQSGPVDMHGIVKLDLLLTMDIDGDIKVAGVILNDALDLYLGDQPILAAYLGDELVWSP